MDVIKILHDTRTTLRLMANDFVQDWHNEDRIKELEQEIRRLRGTGTNTSLSGASTDLAITDFNDYRADALPRCVLPGSLPATCLQSCGDVGARDQAQAQRTRGNNAVEDHDNGGARCASAGRVSPAPDASEQSGGDDAAVCEERGPPLMLSARREGTRSLDITTGKLRPQSSAQALIWLPSSRRAVSSACGDKGGVDDKRNGDGDKQRDKSFVEADWGFFGYQGAPDI